MTTVTSTGRPPVPVADGIWALRRAMPHGVARTSWSYLIEDCSGSLAIVDPGWPLDVNWTGLIAAVGARQADLGNVSAVFSTHAHLDHFGLSGRIRAAAGTTVAVPRAELSHIDTLDAPDDPAARLTRAQRWGVPEWARDRLGGAIPERLSTSDLTVDLALDEGEALPLGDDGWQVLATPGHTAGHACLVHHGRRVVFTGDHVLPGQSPGIGLGGLFEANPLAALLASLERTAALDGYLALPGHGDPFRTVADEAAAIRRHHLGRRGQVAAALTGARVDRPPSVWELARRVGWRGGFEGLRGNRLRFALQQVEIYRDHILFSR